MTQVPTVTLNDGNPIPQLGYGVWQVSTDDIVPAVLKALEVGYRHIDTAAIYGNEEGVGRAIAESGIPREELFVTTKLWNERHDDAPAAIQESLTKLGLDYVDLYLIHWPAPKADKYLTAWQSLEQFTADGLARSVGVSNFHASHLQKILNATSTVPAVNQIEVHPTFAQTELIATNTSYGITTESWSPLGLSQDLDNSVIISLAEELGRTPAQVILRWHIQKGYVVFPKSVTPSRIAENFDVFGFELDDAQIATIDGLDSGNRTGGDPDTFG